jgi:hypothetical protein
MPPHVSAIEPTTPVNRDPLTDQFTRGRISNAQLRAGQEFRKLLAIAKEGTDDHRAADEALARSYQALGTDGSALVHDMLIDGMTAKQVAEARGLTGQGWSKYYAKRFSECLNTLTGIFGFANATSRSRQA